MYLDDVANGTQQAGMLHDLRQDAGYATTAAAAAAASAAAKDALFGRRAGLQCVYIQ